APALAPQTSDTLSLVIAATVMALGSAVIISKKRR
ncbi:MAG: LPXTG cell wall anchor domain-containing protein, partial [Clostridiales bacterium]|nr:LPXTG cell wall anchor domain-containing protein [Clostridiales bacterium]